MSDVNNEESKKILARIMILYKHMDKIKERFPKPRRTDIQDIISMFEQKILNETDKLRRLQNK